MIEPGQPVIIKASGRTGQLVRIEKGFLFLVFLPDEEGVLVEGFGIGRLHVHRAHDIEPIERPEPKMRGFDPTW